MSTENVNFIKAVIKGKASKELTPNVAGSRSVIFPCEILEGPAKGKTVPGKFTFVNSFGKEKSLPEVDDEIGLVHNMLPSTKEAGKYVHFFEISRNAFAQATNDELTELFGVESAVSDQNAL